MTLLLLVLLTLATPGHAATTDLTMTVFNGRPVFRPADGLDCYTAKCGGQVIDCALADAPTMRPRRAPCWLRPDLRGPCPMGAAVMAAFDAPPVRFAVEPVASVPRAPHVPQVPLPASLGLLLAALVMLRRLG